MANEYHKENKYTKGRYTEGKYTEGKYPTANKEILLEDIYDTKMYIAGYTAGYAIDPKNDEERKLVEEALDLAIPVVKNTIGHYYDYKKASFNRYDPYATKLYSTEYEYAWGVALTFRYTKMPDDDFLYAFGFLAGYRKRSNERTAQARKDGIARLKEIAAQLSSDR